jgi:hypothetical protein
LIDNYLPHQLEKRFGGQAESPKQYWPPIIPNLIFKDDDEYLMREEHYEEMIRNNPLLKRRPPL